MINGQEDLRSQMISEDSHEKTSEMDTIRNSSQSYFLKRTEELSPLLCLLKQTILSTSSLKETKTSFFSCYHLYF